MKFSDLTNVDLVAFENFVSFGVCLMVCWYLSRTFKQKNLVALAPLFVFAIVYIAGRWVDLMTWYNVLLLLYFIYVSRKSGIRRRANSPLDNLFRSFLSKRVVRIGGLIVLLLVAIVFLLPYNWLRGLQTHRANQHLMSAVFRGDPQAVDRALDEGADVETTTVGTKLTPLQMASAIGRAEVIAPLLARGARINGPDEYGETPLMLAAVNGHLESVKKLLAHGADVNATQYSGGVSVLSQARHSPRKSQRTAIIALLTQAGAK